MQEDRSNTLSDDELIHTDNYEDRASDLIDEDEIMNYLEANASITSNDPIKGENPLSIEDKAAAAIEIYKKIKNLEISLNEYKEFFREHANSEKFEMVIKNVGKLSVSKPTPMSEKVVLTVDMAKIEKSAELKAKLLSSGLLKEEKKSVGGAAASVRITLL